MLKLKSIPEESMKEKGFEYLQGVAHKFRKIEKPSPSPEVKPSEKKKEELPQPKQKEKPIRSVYDTGCHIS
jgi:hypothetical protein